MMENSPGLAVSGTSVVVPECPKCSRKNAPGVLVTREIDGCRFFKCDICGMKRKYGHEEKFAEIIDAEAEGYRRAQENRERYQRESNEEFMETYQDAMENLTVAPDAVQHFQQTHQGLMLERQRQMAEDK